MSRKGIITVTLNPSVDVTLWLDGMHPDKANRVLRETREVGGKGINVSRVVRAFGLESLCVTVAGEDNSRELISFLEADGLHYELVPAEGAVRENLTLRTDGQTIKINRKGPALSDMMFNALMALIRSRLHPGDIVVFGGSLPENVALQDYVELILAVRNAGALVALDSDLLSLEDYARIRPWAIKPNIHELKNIVPVDGTTITDVAAAALRLREVGVENVLVSLGGNGLLSVSEEGVLNAVVPQVEVKSTVGAGDSLLGGFVVGTVKEMPYAERVRLAAACGTASVMLEGTAVADKAAAMAVMENVRVEKLDG